MLLFAHVGLALATARLSNRLDLLFLALGSMLPDIIDKPLGLLALGSPNMGRTFAHTFLFLLILAAVSFRLRDIRSASLTWGVLVHLILDSMWGPLRSLSSGLSWADFQMLHIWIHSATCRCFSWAWRNQGSSSRN